jgi:SsrA-binding protein
LPAIAGNAVSRFRALDRRDILKYTLKGGRTVASRERRPIASNKKAYHDYFVEDKYEAGISLAGTEVKSIRQGGVNLKDAYCTVTNGELLVRGLRISPYEKGNIFNKDPLRTRRLLMHKREINRLFALVKQDGYALIPLSVYFNEASRVKVELGLCKGKKLYDKRASSAERDAKREIDRTMKQRR